MAIAKNISTNEVDWLLQAITNLSSLSLRLETFQNQQQILSSKSILQLSELWQKRIQERQPLQYLVETVFWRNFQLKVTPSVLIPRPETELIIDIALQAAREKNITKNISTGEHWVDLGTGSGAIALALATSFPQANIHAVDCSPEALLVAQENAANLAANLNLVSKIRFYQGSWWNPLHFLQGKVTAMVSNPPYIPTHQISQLQPEVVQHEPHLALDGGQDGLDNIRHLLQAAPDYLVTGGIWLIEMMLGQSDTVVEMLERHGEYYDIKTFSDLGGIERFALAYRR